MDDIIVNLKDKGSSLDDKVMALKDKTRKLILSEEFQSVKITMTEFKVLNQLLSANSSRDINMYEWNVGITHRTVDKLRDKINIVKAGCKQ